MFWADSIVEEIIRTRKAPYKVYDWWTPSGMAHAGHIRTFLLHQAIYQGLRLRGHDVAYYYGFDDMDPMDGMPPDVPESYRQYMGMPLYVIPSPFPGYDSLGGYYAAKYLEAMEVLDIHPEVPTTSEMYRSGAFNETITLTLENAEKIRAIYADLGAERPVDWHAFQVVCEQCGRIGTTYVYDWDGNVVRYRCEPKLVQWAEGCDYHGEVSPYNGSGKLPWKVEWAAKWFLLGTSYEGGGKDHFTKNGSRDYARRIVLDVFQADEPIGYPHEFFLIGGKKMSSSKGLGLTANDAAQILPPLIMRYYVYRTPLNRQIEFSPQGDAIPRIYDEFDRGLAAVRTSPESNEARAMLYAHQSSAPLPEYVMRFSKVTFLIQMPHVSIKEIAAQEKGSSLTTEESNELDLRTEYARRWLDTYAGEESKFTLQPELPTVSLTQEQQVYLATVLESLRSSDWTGESIHGILHGVKQDMRIAPSIAFSALYLIFLAKEQGPQAGWFLASLDRAFVLQRLEESTSLTAKEI